MLLSDGWSPTDVSNQPNDPRNASSVITATYWMKTRSFHIRTWKHNLPPSLSRCLPFVSTVKPSPPVNLSHVQTIDGQLALQWHSPAQPSDLGPLSYQVRYSANAGQPNWQVKIIPSPRGVSRLCTAPGHYRSSALTLIPDQSSLKASARKWDPFVSPFVMSRILGPGG